MDKINAIKTQHKWTDTDLSQALKDLDPQFDEKTLKKIQNDKPISKEKRIVLETVLRILDKKK